MAETAEVSVNEFGVDVAVRTIRGRSCPICGGKIIPSNRAVYQSAGDPTEVYALWECERCRYAERFEKPEETKKVHGAATKALPAGDKTAAGTLSSAPSTSALTGETLPASKASGRAAAKRAMPHDVRKMLEVMKGKQPKVED